MLPDVDEEGHPAWNLVVTGKGGKQREVPLTGRMTKLLFEHLAAKGLGQEVRDIDPNTPLLSALWRTRCGRWQRPGSTSW